MDLQPFLEIFTNVAQAATEAVQEAGHAASTVAETTTEAAHTAEETGVAGMFGISWSLFIAQLVNFGIVLFVLWKWVFTPVTKALQARTERIEKSLQDASGVEREKIEFEGWKRQAMADARKEASVIIEQAKTEAENLRDQVLQKTKDEQQAVVAHTKRQLEKETEEAVRAAKSEISGLVVEATEIILKEKIDAKKDQGLISKALEKLSA